MLRAVLALALASTLAGCFVGDDGDDATVDNSDGDEGGFAPEAVGDAHDLRFGFDGPTDQLAYFDDFYGAATVNQGARLCHTYLPWNVANQAPNHGDATSRADRAYLDAWLRAAQGHCDEALISFKAMTHQAPPTKSAYATAVTKFVATDWAAETGFTGAFSFTPWNEPNNADDAGTGLGVAIDARLAADYYLSLEKACRAHGCKVAAGDFASNGTMWNAFEWNCANDNVAEADLCKTKSDVSTGGASYLDKYKNEIANQGKTYGLGAGFRPEYFGYHGWHDTNEYLNSNSHCGTYDNCALRRILKSLGGSWGGVILWDTEDGVGQNVDPGDVEQGCGAAFLQRLVTISSRVHRVYLTRLHGGGGQLLAAHALRPAATNFAHRVINYTAGHCD
ncbi:MAG TPA: hypothetical protein VGM88_33055 [Kofleriaceae bacterium]|jgi:hypothetical protein